MELEVRKINFNQLLKCHTLLPQSKNAEYWWIILFWQLTLNTVYRPLRKPTADYTMYNVKRLLAWSKNNFEEIHIHVSQGLNWAFPISDILSWLYK